MQPQCQYGNKNKPNSQPQSLNQGADLPKIKHDRLPPKSKYQAQGLTLLSAISLGIYSAFTLESFLVQIASYIWCKPVVI